MAATAPRAWNQDVRPPRRKPARAARTAQSALALLDRVQARESPWRARRAAAEAYLAEVDGRRCAVCGCQGPAFGFGPPLVPAQIWACRAHRLEVDPAGLPDWLR